MNLAIIGATGLVGLELVKKALADEKFKTVISITRRSLGFSSEKLVEVIISEFTADKIEELDIKADIYVCALGTTIKVAGSKDKFFKVDHDYVLSFAKLAKYNRAQALFVISAKGSDPESSIFYNQVKGKMEEAVKKLGLQSLYILRPGLLIGDRVEKRIGEEVGLAIFKALEVALPKKITRRVGTKVLDICGYILSKSSSLKPGIQIIESHNIK